jgi:hypothetical protein
MVHLGVRCNFGPLANERAIPKPRIRQKTAAMRSRSNILKLVRGWTSLSYLIDRIATQHQGARDWF